MDSKFYAIRNANGYPVGIAKDVEQAKHMINSLPDFSVRSFYNFINAKNWLAHNPKTGPCYVVTNAKYSGIYWTEFEVQNATNNGITGSVRRFSLYEDAQVWYKKQTQSEEKINHMYYAVREGWKVGVYDTLAESIHAVRGYPKPLYRNFKNKEDALEWVKNGDKDWSTEKDFYQPEYVLEEANGQNFFRQRALDPQFFENTDETRDFQKEIQELNTKGYSVAFSDGSYSQQTQMYAYGISVYHTSGEKYLLYGGGKNEDYVPYGNLAGEVLGLINVLRWAEKKSCPKIKIFYDFEQIKFYLQDKFGKNIPIVKELKELYDKIKLNSKISLEFIHGHIQNVFHDEADRLAKYARFEAENKKIFEFDAVKKVNPLQMSA